MEEHKQDRDWGFLKRNLWWIKYAVVFAALWGVNRAFNEWISTRASIDYVNKQVETRESKEDAAKTKAAFEIVVTETKTSIKENERVLGNVRDNLLILMDRQRIQTLPMPSRDEQ